MRNKIIKYSNRKFIIYDFMEGEIDTTISKKNRFETQLDFTSLVGYFVKILQYDLWMNF